jgi:hypothetical protein
VWNLISDIKGRTYMGVFENGVLRRIFGLKRGEILGGCRKLHNEELHDFHSSPKTCDNASKDDMDIACSIHGSGRMDTWFCWERQKERDR